MNFFVSICIAIMLMVNISTGFTINNNYRIPATVTSVSNNIRSSSRLFTTETETETASSEESATKKSLEEKMKEWEASDEEIKAASLGGITPGKADGFDIGLFLAFPFIVGSALFFAVFPFIMDKIDVSSVGPPPTV